MYRTGLDSDIRTLISSLQFLQILCYFVRLCAIALQIHILQDNKKKRKFRNYVDCKFTRYVNWKFTMPFNSDTIVNLSIFFKCLLLNKMLHVYKERINYLFRERRVFIVFLFLKKVELNRSHSISPYLRTFYKLIWLG